MAETHQNNTVVLLPTALDEPFDIPVTYKGEDRAFPARLLHTGYSHKFVVDVYGAEIFFEPDEERTYRAMLDPEAAQGNSTIDVQLLKAIAEAIEAIVN